MTITIKADHKWKQLRYGYEVPKSIMADQFEHLAEDGADGDGFILYRKRWYHLSDFMSCHNEIHSPGNPFKALGYDGYLSNSFFSGIVVKVSNDGESYQIGTYFS